MKRRERNGSSDVVVFEKILAQKITKKTYYRPRHTLQAHFHIKDDKFATKKT